MTCLNNEIWSRNYLSFNIQNSAEVVKVIFSSNTFVTTPDCYIMCNCLNQPYVVLNVDGSYLGTPQRTGFGGLLRNSAGFYVSDFFGFIDSLVLLLELGYYNV